MSKLILLIQLLFVMLFTNTILKAQEENKSTSKSMIGAAISGVLPNSNYGEDHFGLDVFFRHNFKFMKDTNSYLCINANYINYKDDSITKNDYLITLGSLGIHKLVDDFYFSISYCYSVEFGVLNKNGLYYGALNYNSGFVLGISKHFNIEPIIKLRFNRSDNFHTSGMLGLSYSF